MSLYERLFELSDFWVFIVSVVGVWLLSLLATLFMVVLKSLFPHKGPSLVATMLTGILLPTGMVITFVASDVWQSDAKGRVAVEEEASAISDSLRVTKHLSAAQARPITALIKEYARSAVEVEWPLMSKSDASDETEEYLEQLMVAAVSLQASQVPGSAQFIAAQELRKYVTRIELARDTRLRVSQVEVQIPKWVAVFVMLFVSACVLAELHISSRRALAISTLLFSLGFGVTIYLIAAYDRPFTGKTIIDPWSLEQILKRSQADRADNSPLSAVPAGSIAQ